MKKSHVFVHNLIILLLLLPLSLLLAGCGKQGEVIDNTSNSNNSTMKKLDADKYCEEKTGQKSCPASGEEIAVISTNYGDITIKFFDAQAPKTVANFKKLTNDGFYSNLIFHRMIKGFMIQGGDPEGSGSGGPGYTTPAEISSDLTHTAGAVATARLGDDMNPDKDSSGSQFYIVEDDTGATSLDGDYTIFGQVIAGMNVVEKIANVETGVNDKPKNDVIIEKIELIKY